MEAEGKEITISAKEEGGLGALRKEALVLAKDLKLLDRQIEEKRKELEAIPREIQLAREELLKVRNLKMPLIESLKAQETELLKTLSNLKQSYQLIVEREKEAKEHYAAERVGQNAKLKQISDEIGYAEERLEYLKREIAAHEERKHELREGIEKEREKETVLVKKIFDLQQTVSKENEELAKLSEIKKEVEEALASYGDFAEQMEELRIELEGRERFLDLLERRLLPSYLKTFGRFANLKVENTKS